MRASGSSHQGWLWVAVVCVLVSAGAEWWRYGKVPWRRGVSLVAAPALSPHWGHDFTLSERSSHTLPMPQGVPFAHASALAVLPDGDLLATWWAGARESAPDVKLYIARWNQGRWGPARMVVDRASLGSALQLGVRRIGNPVLWVSPDGRVHLYLVATGLGGWAASRVAQLVSNDEGQTFTARRVLPLTPWFNTSVLVRTRPVAVADGGWLLPAYFELGTKYPMVVAFGPDGEPRWTQRIGESRSALQPALMTRSSGEVLAVMRDVSQQRRVQQAESVDGGLTWQDLPPNELVNQDNSLAGLQLAHGGYALLHNDAVPGDGSPRQWLRLSVSLDGKTWQPGPDVQRGLKLDEFSYPSLVQIGHQLHVTYTLQRRAIAHRVYDIQYWEAPPP